MKIDFRVKPKLIGFNCTAWRMKSMSGKATEYLIVANISEDDKTIESIDCSCPAFQFKSNEPCKHIKAVLETTDW